MAFTLIIFDAIIVLPACFLSSPFVYKFYILKKHLKFKIDSLQSTGKIEDNCTTPKLKILYYMNAPYIISKISLPVLQVIIRYHMRLLKKDIFHSFRHCYFRHQNSARPFLTKMLNILKYTKEASSILKRLVWD